MSDLICGLIVLAVAMPIAAWLLPKLNLYRDSLVCGLCKRVLPGSRNAHPRPDVARCRNCRIHEEQQIATLVATDESELFGRPTQRSTSSVGSVKEKWMVRQERRADRKVMEAYLREFLHDLSRLHMLSTVAAEEQKRRDEHDH